MRESQKGTRRLVWEPAWETRMDLIRSPVWRWERFAALSLNLVLWMDIVRFVAMMARVRI